MALAIARPVMPDNGLRNYLRQVPNDCVLYYPGLDYGNWYTTTILDYSGQANNGTITGATTTKCPSGLYCLDYDGADDNTNSGSGASLDDIALLSFESWIYLDSYGEGPNLGRIWDKGNREMHAAGTAGVKARLEFYDERWATSGIWYTNVDTILVDTWYHVALTYSDSSIENDPIFYINGVSVNVTEQQKPVAALGSDAANALIIGNNVGTTRAFDGRQAINKFFDVIRTPAQILDDYQKELPFVRGMV